MGKWCLLDTFSLSFLEAPRKSARPLGSSHLMPEATVSHASRGKAFILSEDHHFSAIHSHYHNWNSPDQRPETRLCHSTWEIPSFPTSISLLVKWALSSCFPLPPTLKGSGLCESILRKVEMLHTYIMCFNGFMSSHPHFTDEKMSLGYVKSP